MGSTFESRMDEYTQSKVIVQTQMLRSKLSYFRMLLACATLNEEQRFALHQFATELQTTMDVVLARNAAYDEALAYAQASSRAPSEDDITNIPLDSLASPASTSSWDGTLSFSSESGAESATFSGEAAPFDFVAPSFAPLPPSAIPQVFQDSMCSTGSAMPTFNQNVLRSPINLSSMQAGSSHVHLSPQAQVPTSLCQTASSAETDDLSSAHFTLHGLWPHGNLEWASPPCHSASDHGTTLAFASPASQIASWSDMYSPGNAYGHTLPSVADMGLSSLYNPEIPSSIHQVQYADDGTMRTLPGTDTAGTALYAGHLPELCEPQAPATDGIARLQTDLYNVGSPLSQSWSSNMSECSIVV